MCMDKNDNNVKRQFQSNFNSSLVKLESKTLESYMKCYDPQLQGYFMHLLVTKSTPYSISDF